MIDPHPGRFEMPSIEGLRGQRDPYAFYSRNESEKPSAKQEFEREEFCHEEIEPFKISVLFPRATRSRGALMMRGSARNTKRMNIAIPLEHSAKEVDPIQALEKMIRAIGSK